MCEYMSVVLAFAVDSGGVQRVTKRTLAAERAVCVDAHAVGADVGVGGALVDVYKRITNTAPPVSQLIGR